MENDRLLVTLVTDFGTRDYYVGMVKGAILQAYLSVDFVDVTHHVNSYDIVQAAFIVRNVYSSYPRGTVHLVSVNNFYSKRYRTIAFQHDGHWFVGPDNGVFSLIFGDGVTDAVVLSGATGALYIKEVFAAAVQGIARGATLNDLGTPLERIEERITLQPVINRYQIVGSVIHIDAYENCVLNVNRALFERVRDGRRFALFFKRNNPIVKLSEHYYDVPVGEPLCLFNSADYLEIAVNMGKASSLLSLEVEDAVQIDFI